MRRLAGLLLLLVLSTGAGIALVWLDAGRQAPSVDVTVLNDAAGRVEATWPNVAQTGLDQLDAEVSVVSASGELLTSTATDPLTNELDAARARAMAAPVVVGGQIVAMVYVASGVADAEAANLTRQATAATIAIIVVTGVAAAVLVRVQRRIIAPFDSLQGFATRVASGDLEAPLEMDRGNVFGAWSESFDLMRSELASARAQQAAAEQSKRELVAQISHDIRTPVAAISATTELLELGETDAARQARLDVIRAKTSQIENLVSDLFDAREAELAALAVNPRDLTSTEVTALLRGSDHAGRIGPFELPDCLVRADPVRLAQVFDNIVTNSYKYADTSIDVASRLAGDALEITIADHGPGVPADEVDAIFARGVRGSNVADRPGHGLGLFTAAYLTERMGGDISAANAASGFAVTITLGLA